MSLPLDIEITLPTGDKYTQPTGLFINNEFVKSIKGETIETVNPATGEVICPVYLADVEDTDVAIAAARECFETVWFNTAGYERSKYLYKIATLMEENKEILADIEALDSGKPRKSNAIYDVLHCIDVIKYYAGVATTAQSGKTIESTPDKFTYTVHEPFGVCGQIIPWNYPLAMAIWKIAPALSAGNVVVMKTSENTPLSLLYLCKLVKESGLPKGVINVICGLGRTCGSHLASHMDIDKVSFTGSTAVGKLIQQLASSNLKAVTMECGGKSPLIIYDDCNFEQAVKWAAFGIMYNMGQICTGSSRIYVQDTIHDKFVEALAKHVKEIYVQGDPFTDGVQVGPQVSKIQQERVLGYINSGIEEGATVALGGKIPEGFPEASCFIEPTIFSNVNQNMKIVREEIFGPVVTVGKFSTEKEAIELANDTIYGLAAYVFTENVRKAQHFARKVKSGQIYVNETNASDFRVPFGGYKLSGFGRELGEYGISMYTQAKAVHINIDREL